MAKQVKKLAYMTWVEIKNVINKGNAICIIPVGSTEQHGPHMVEGTDSFIAEFISNKLAQELGNSIIAPTINFGFSDYHLAFPGTISISRDLLKAILLITATNLINHGFKYVIYIPGHGGDFDSCNDACRELNIKYGKEMVLTYPSFTEFSNAISKPCLDAGLKPDDVGAHSGVGETSLMMYIDQNLVRMDKLQKGSTGNLTDMRKTMLTSGTDKVSPIGVLGDPLLARNEYGKDGAENVFKMLLDYLRKHINFNE